MTEAPALDRQSAPDARPAVTRAGDRRGRLRRLPGRRAARSSGRHRGHRPRRRRAPSRGEEVSRLPGVELQVVDLRDRRRAGRGCRACATPSSTWPPSAPRRRASGPRDAHDVNVGTTYDLLHPRHRRTACDGSCSAPPTRCTGLIWTPTRRPSSEAQPWVCQGINMYAATKLASEAYLEAFASAGGPDYVALRIGPIYGPRVSPGSNGAMTLDLLEALDKGEQPVVRWAQDAIHSFVYVDDVAAAAIAALHLEQTNLAVNVVGEPITTAALCERAVELYGHDPSLIEWREERIRYQRVSQERMREVLGFVPATTTDEGLHALIEWHRGRARHMSTHTPHRPPTGRPLPHGSVDAIADNVIRAITDFTTRVDVRRPHPDRPAGGQALPRRRRRMRRRRPADGRHRQAAASSRPPPRAPVPPRSSAAGRRRRPRWRPSSTGRRSGASTSTTTTSAPSTPTRTATRARTPATTSAACWQPRRSPAPAAPTRCSGSPSPTRSAASSWTRSSSEATAGTTRPSTRSPPPRPPPGCSVWTPLARRDALRLAVVPNICLYETRVGAISNWKGLAGPNGSRNGLFAALLAEVGHHRPRHWPSKDPAGS